jgi:hypothetical protein
VVDFSATVRSIARCVATSCDEQEYASEQRGMFDNSLSNKDSREYSAIEL